MKIVVLIGFLCFGLRSHAIGQVDSATAELKWYHSPAFRTACLPVVLTGYGLSVIGHGGLFLSSYQLRNDVIKTFPGFHTTVDNYLVLSPAALALGLKLGGVKTKHDYKEGFILYALSASITMGITYGLKYTVLEERPDRSDAYSFPSSRTSFSFQGAEFLHQEYIDQSAWYSVAGYTLAAATGGLRILNNKHWLSDVCVGAGIGILTTRLVYLAYPLVQKKFQHKKNG